ncbi:Uncharacterised protein [Bordetella pertussis]|nr:Uncharacterised protein [Bordetella pertussis]CPI08126.1 Uncharacterised protein [Bordetella pertussis]CPJ24216.1 Uncharacterised protein [Bordetella pertussis]CPL33587.1 Uncharacterised protein [Bordetella pertussis]CPO10031.1 Uncharacterised protein [Bordetella pertussis]
MLNALGVSGPTRSLAVPEIPTLAEGMGAVAASAEFREFAREQGVEPAFMGPDAWPAEAADQQARWSGLLREAGLIKPKQG